MSETAQFLAGAWCLDFANTVEPRGEARNDYVPDYAALADWSQRAGLISAGAAADLQREAQDRPVAARASHKRAIELREATYRIFRAVATDQPPTASDLTTLHEHHAEAVARATPHWDGGLQWDWTSGLDLPRWLLVEDAVQLLQSPRLDRVKMCRPSCGWLFLDLTRNASRRWCSTDDCGLREKLRRQTERRALRRRA